MHCLLSCHWAWLRRVWLQSLCSSIRYLYNGEDTPELSLLNSPSSFGLSLLYRCFCSFIIFAALLWSHSSISEECRSAASTPKHRSIIFLNLLASVVPLQLRMLLATFITRAHCWITVSLVSTLTDQESGIFGALFLIYSSIPLYWNYFLLHPLYFENWEGKLISLKQKNFYEIKVSSLI